MKIHFYTLCWNDGPRVTFFFRHYDKIVDRYIVYDDGSNEKTLARLRANPKVEIRKFRRSVSSSFVLSEKELSDHCWKESRGEADWVIVADMDELLYHRDVIEYLSICKRGGITAIPALGFQMISKVFPSEDTDLAATLTQGMPWRPMMKLAVFDPEAVREINFAEGRHQALPVGRIVYPDSDELLLLHYKYLGLFETFRRHQEQARGLGQFDIQKRLGFQYTWDFLTYSKVWNEFSSRAGDYRIYAEGDKQAFPIRPWWRK